MIFFFLPFSNDVENQPYDTILGSLYYPLKMLDILEDKHDDVCLSPWSWGTNCAVVKK